MRKSEQVTNLQLTALEAVCFAFCRAVFPSFVCSLSSLEPVLGQVEREQVDFPQSQTHLSGAPASRAPREQPPSLCMAGKVRVPALCREKNFSLMKWASTVP